MKKICIIGGGASGMAAAVKASASGAKVTILEHKDGLGKKILSTGNGRCNLTNMNCFPGCYRGEVPEFAYHVLTQYNPEYTVCFFKEIGLLTKAKDGYVYPRTNQAETVRGVLADELARLHVHSVFNAHVYKVEKKQGVFQVFTEGFNDPFYADSVILSAGGRAAPCLGSDGSGYHIAKALGHSITPVVPSLVQLRARDSFLKKAAPVRAMAKVSILINGQCAASDTGELQITDYGISGIPVFQVSRYAAMGLIKKQEILARLDFIPELTKAEWKGFLRERAAARPDSTAAGLLLGSFHKKLVPVLLHRAGIRSDVKLGELNDSAYKRIVWACKQFDTVITGTNSFEQAQVCAGGVRTDEVCGNTMESKCTPGFYLTGEILDIDGICGGYNLQWAFSSGFLAGMSAAV